MQLFFGAPPRPKRCTKAQVTDVLIENGYQRACVKIWSKLSAGLCVRKCEAMKEKGFVCLPYVEGLSKNIRRVLRKVGI